MELDGKSLPAFCPNPAMTLWSQHPRVFLDMSAGEAMCPYCGTRYRLKPGTRIRTPLNRPAGQALSVGGDVRRKSRPAGTQV